MSKRVVLLAGVIALMLAAQAAPAFAQASPSGGTVGVIAGLNLSMPKYSPDVEDALAYDGSADSKGKMGFLAGVTFDMNVAPKFAFRVQGTVVQTGQELSGSFVDDGFEGSETITHTATQLEVGALAVIPMGAEARANLLAGLFFAFNISDSIEVETCFDECTTAPPNELGFKSTNASLGFGVEFKASDNVVVGALYKLGLTNFEDSNPPPFFDSVKMNALQLFVRVAFGG